MADTQDPAEDVAAFLALAVTGLIRPPGDGANLFTGQVRAAAEGQVPQSAVFVMDDDSGGDASPYLAAGTDNLATVGVTVRGAPDARADAKALAAALRFVLLRAQLPGYYSCWVPQALPVYMGQDDDGCPLFEFDVELDWTGSG